MAPITQLMSTDNAIFRAWIFYGCILSLKMLAMSLLTARQRFKKKVFANPEDRLSKEDKVKFDDPDVERVRRAHLNDLENIVVYFAASFFYLLTDPSAFVAINLFRAYTMARIAHTFVYAVYPIPQPARALAWFVGYGITGYMAVMAMMTYM